MSFLSAFYHPHFIIPAQQNLSALNIQLELFFDMSSLTWKKFLSAIMARKLLKERSAPSAHSRKRMIIINRYQTTFISRLVHSYCGLLL